MARTVHPRADAQEMHVDFARDQYGWPMVGFILMLDEFTRVNGATRFVPGSHHYATSPHVHSLQESALVRACGPQGGVIVYNGSVLHGHGPNRTDRPRRSIQGAYIGRDANGFGVAARTPVSTRERTGPLAAYLIHA